VYEYHWSQAGRVGALDLFARSVAWETDIVPLRHVALWPHQVLARLCPEVESHHGARQRD